MNPIKTLWKHVKEAFAESKRPVLFIVTKWISLLIVATALGTIVTIAVTALINRVFPGPDVRGMPVPKIEAQASRCAAGFDRALEISFKDHALVDFDRGRLLEWSEYTQTQEYKERQQHSGDASYRVSEAHYLPGYELALTYLQDDQLLYGHKGFPVVLIRDRIAASKLLYDDLKKVEISALKEALQGKKDGPSPLDDGIWAIRTSEGNLVTLEIRGLPPSSTYPHTPRGYEAKLYACFYSNSWF